MGAAPARRERGLRGLASERRPERQGEFAALNAAKRGSQGDRLIKCPQFVPCATMAAGLTDRLWLSPSNIHFLLPRAIEKVK